VQTAKTFQLQRNSAVTAAAFPQSFQQFLCESFFWFGGPDLIRYV
jgi:hypothetical protein